MSLSIGDTIDDKYRIVRLLGEGGMGSVFEGENTRIHRRVAIKVLHASVAESKDAVQRFEREAQAAGRIGSEHIVEVLDLGELPDGDRYMVMEYLEGEALSDRIESSKGLSPQKTATLIIEMLEGLKAAHEKGIIHRDLKPDNVFLLENKNGRNDFVKIVDFGISKFSTLGGEFSMTQTGAVMGTPYYLSPEQAKGERSVDHRADLYAVGVILWEAVAGKVPFDGETFNELLFKIVLEPLPKLEDAVEGLDPHFISIVDKAMARDANLRFQSAEEMQLALSSWLEGQPPAPELLADAATSRNSLSSSASVLAQTAQAQTTNGNWAQTNPEASAAPQSKKWVLISAAAVLVAAVSGVLIVQEMNSQDAAEARAAAQAEEEKEREREAEQRAELARLEAERAQAEAERAKAEQARSEAEREKAKANLSAAQRSQEAEARRLEEEKKKAAARAAQARAARQQRPAPAPAPAPAPSGRIIRTDL